MSAAPGPPPAKPLSGRTVLITRASGQAGVLEESLSALGASVLSIPAIEFTDPDDPGPLDRAIESIDSFDWILFTSANGVLWFWKRFEATRGSSPAEALSRMKVAAIGPATASVLKERGSLADVVPPVYRAEALAEAIPRADLEGRRVLIARAQRAREIVPDSLRSMGAEVVIAACYKTVPPGIDADSLAMRFERKEIDLVTFTSASTVENFVNLFPEGSAVAILSSVKTACIGPITAACAVSLGIEPTATADESTIAGLVRVITRLLARA